MRPVYTTQPATADRWGDVVTVMGMRGDPAYCWCQFFLQRGKEARSATRESNRDALRRQVCDGAVAPGILAYDEADPVGWCAVAPKSSYPRLLASPVAGSAVDGVWSVSCFVVRVGDRRRGVAATLLDGAVRYAWMQGAGTIEGYPVDPGARKSVSSAELYHGVLSAFLAAGFTEVSRPYPARAVVRLERGG